MHQSNNQTNGNEKDINIPPPTAENGMAPIIDGGDKNQPGDDGKSVEMPIESIKGGEEEEERSVKDALGILGRQNENFIR